MVMLSSLRNSVSNKFEFDGIHKLTKLTLVETTKIIRKIKIENTQGRTLKTKIPVFGMVNN